MKAVRFKSFGLPEKVLTIDKINRPEPASNEVLVRIHASTINDYEWSLVRGQPYIYRLMFGLFKPRKKNQVIGMELAGVIEKVGHKVTKFKVGDQVFGDTSHYKFGTLAEYISIDEKALLKQPDHVSFEEAASLPHAFTLALQSLRDIGRIKNGQKVLINGGGGGVGTFGLQLAKLQDCEVTGVDSADKLDMMTKLGYDHVIDYTEENFTKSGNKYDLILDCKTSQSSFSYLKVLSQKGHYITIGGKIKSLLSLFLMRKFIHIFSSKRLDILSLEPNKGLELINELSITNKLRFLIDGPYPLEETPRLIQYFGDGLHKGKIVIKIV